MACRDMKKCEAVKKKIVEISFNQNIHCKKLDLASLESIQEFCDNINQSEKRLDILINNAGVMGLRKKEYTQDGFEMQLGVNYFGHFLLTHLLLDKLKQSSPSRIINLSSAAYKKGAINFDDLNSAKFYRHDVAYAQSKLAIVLFNRKLSRILEGTNVSTYVVYPGLVKTQLGRHLSISKSKVSGTIVSPFANFMMKNVEQGIQTILYCALNPALSKQSGRYYVSLHTEEVTPIARDIEVEDRLYAISKVWTKLQNL